MKDPRINFRSPGLAAVLAFLIPGAGHFYQGRTLKGGIFFFGILSLFFGGMILGDWQPVYSQVAYVAEGNRPDSSLQMEPKTTRIGTNFSIGYAAQVLVGLPAVPSLIQQMRFSRDSGAVATLREEIDSDFRGVVRVNGDYVPLSGRIRLSPAKLGAGEGTLECTARDGSRISGPISGSVRLGREVFGSPHREIYLAGINGLDVDGNAPTDLHGTVSRSFANWYQAPRDSAELDRLHNKLSQHFDIACVFTWIAGLLNLMAIWDAFDGPAYGYGDEEEENDEDDPESKSNDEETSVEELKTNAEAAS